MSTLNGPLAPALIDDNEDGYANARKLGDGADINDYTVTPPLLSKGSLTSSCLYMRTLCDLYWYPQVR